MGLRSPSRTTTATSGPGRGPVSDSRMRSDSRTRPGSRSRSDSRTRHRRRLHRGAARRREASAEALRLRAERLFAPEPQRTRVRGRLRHGPPAEWGDGGGDGALQGREELRDRPSPARSRPRTSSVSGWSPGAGAGAGALGDADGAADEGAGEGADRGAEEVVVAEDVEGAVGVVEEVRRASSWRARAGLAVRERMPLWVQSRCGLERRSVAALSVVLVVAAVLAAQHFWSGRTQPVRAPEVVRAAVPYGEEGQGGQKTAAGTTAVARAPVGAGTGPPIVVDISGKVREPGIHRLPAGSRVADALKAAGGVRPGTDTEGLNRARFLVDGEQVVVGAPPTAAGPGAAGVAGGTGPGGAVPDATAPVALNTATLEQLDTLPGVGPVLAQHIIDYRTRQGGFRSVDELREVNGIGDRRFADLQNRVRP
ncbi:ComEA family DNA-binding protein [Streptomyces sp. NBC_00414]|uniref:ComEA family DNA-binding protein n=1 Tax=Streptomyces sp. NBC_00414 TaxID=2975739 RepID=UPI002E22392D